MPSVVVLGVHVVLDVVVLLRAEPPYPLLDILFTTLVLTRESMLMWLSLFRKLNELTPIFIEGFCELLMDLTGVGVGGDLVVVTGSVVVSASASVVEVVPFVVLQSFFLQQSSRQTSTQHRL